MSFLKENINFWEEDITSENPECVTVIEDIFGTRTQEIVESVLDQSSAQVATGCSYFAILDFVCRQPMSCAVMDQNLILPVTII